MKYKQKVYWYEGWPNNGVGWVLFKIPFINRYLIKCPLGTLVLCKKVEDLEDAISGKSKTVADLSANKDQLPDNLLDILGTNKFELLWMKSFLNT